MADIANPFRRWNYGWKARSTGKKVDKVNDALDQINSESQSLHDQYVLTGQQLAAAQTTLADLRSSGAPIDAISRQTDIVVGLQDLQTDQATDMSNISGRRTTKANELTALQTDLASHQQVWRDEHGPVAKFRKRCVRWATKFEDRPAPGGLVPGAKVPKAPFADKHPKWAQARNWFLISAAALGISVGVVKYNTHNAKERDEQEQVDDQQRREQEVSDRFDSKYGNEQELADARPPVAGCTDTYTKQQGAEAAVRVIYGFKTDIIKDLSNITPAEIEAVKAIPLEDLDDFILAEQGLSDSDVLRAQGATMSYLSSDASCAITPEVNDIINSTTACAGKDRAVCDLPAAEKLTGLELGK